MELTLIIIKHDAIQRGLVGKIITRFEERGFQIIANKMVHLTKEKAEAHYSELKDHPFYKTIIERFSSGPGQVIVLAGKNAVAAVRKMIGATDPQKADLGSIRGDFGLSVERNIIHASDSNDNVLREISIWLKAEDLIYWHKEDLNWSNYCETNNGASVKQIDSSDIISSLIDQLKLDINK
jgi:nucleoside-diphosphate kinase